MFNVQRAINLKVSKPELRFMHSASCIMLLYIFVKFRGNITSCIRVMERTRVHDRNGCVQCSKGNNSKRRRARATVHVVCTSSHDALYWCEVSWKYLKRYQSYGADTKLWRADGRTDTQNLGGLNIIPRHCLWRGIKMSSISVTIGVLTYFLTETLI